MFKDANPKSTLKESSVLTKCNLITQDYCAMQNYTREKFSKPIAIGYSSASEEISFGAFGRFL
jgi:hypothetical protein